LRDLAQPHIHQIDGVHAWLVLPLLLLRRRAVDVGDHPVQRGLVALPRPRVGEGDLAEDVEHRHAQCPDVRRRAAELLADELGRDVVRRPARRHRPAGVRRQAEIAEHGAAGGRVEDIGGLDVVVHEVLAVQVVEGTADVAHDGEGVGAGAEEVVIDVVAPHALGREVLCVDVLHVEREVAGVATVELDDGLVVQVVLALVLAQPHVGLADDIPLVVLGLGAGVRRAGLEDFDGDDAVRHVGVLGDEDGRERRGGDLVALGDGILVDLAAARDHYGFLPLHV
ncbi:hypothetical protein CI238_08238, partial [Colletotrichum incanum]